MDYDVIGTGSQFSVDIPSGVTSQSFPITIIDDNLFERTDETFRLTILRTNSTVVTTGSPSTAIIDIRDDESLCIVNNV